MGCGVSVRCEIEMRDEQRPPLRTTTRWIRMRSEEDASMTGVMMQMQAAAATTTATAGTRTCP
jgi:hypothetical protein